MNKQLKNILFIDIETVSQTEKFDELDESLKKQWARKASFLKKETDKKDDDLFFEKAGIFAEFGKVIVIGLGFFHQEEETLQFRTKVLAGEDEKALLTSFKSLVSKMKSNLYLCAHNGKEFDFPYLSRRMLINNITLPEILNLSGKKPWEVKHLDTMDMWKFGDWKHYTSLDLLSAIFGIKSSKNQMDGSMVNSIYYHQHGLDKVAEYCLQDVIVTAQLYAKLKSINIQGLQIIRN